MMFQKGIDNKINAENLINFIQLFDSLDPVDLQVLYDRLFVVLICQSLSWLFAAVKIYT